MSEKTTTDNLCNRLCDLIAETPGIKHRPSVRLAIDIIMDAITALVERDQEIARLRDELAQCGGYNDYAEMLAETSERDKLRRKVCHYISEARRWMRQHDIQTEAVDALEAENRELKDRNAKLSSIISRSVWKGGVCE